MSDVCLWLFRCGNVSTIGFAVGGQVMGSRWGQRSVRLLAMGFVYLVQHGQKRPEPGDPELTEDGGRQAARTGLWLSRFGLCAVYSSPLRRAWQTAERIAAATGLEVRRDDRLRERMNWDGTQSIEDFLADWARCVSDRDYVPHCGDSSRQAAARLRAFLAEQVDMPGAIAAVTHGGVTVDLLRTLVGDGAVSRDLLDNGVPACAVTTLDGLSVVDIAHSSHLA
jgi:broad specificity phosphatase PhoE